MSRGTWVVVAASLGVTAACQDPTQITVRVSTRDIGCGAGGSTLNSTRLQSGVFRQTPSSIVDTSNCSAMQGGARVGELAYAPSDERDAAFSLEVFFGLGDRSGADCASDCSEGCIRASRRMSFVPQQKLYMPIVADLACDGVCCSPGLTCVDGSCVDDQIAPCVEGDPECEPPGTGGGGTGGAGGTGGGGGGPPVANTAEVVDLLALGAVNQVPVLVGNFDVGNGRTAGFVELGQSPTVVRLACQSNTGSVRLDAADTRSNTTYVVGEGSGTVTCSTGQQVQASLDLAGEHGAFYFSVSVLGDIADSALTPLVHWNGAADRFDVLSMAVRKDTGAPIIVSYSEGTVTVDADMGQDLVQASGVNVMTFDDQVAIVRQWTLPTTHRPLGAAVTATDFSSALALWLDEAVLVPGGPMLGAQQGSPYVALLKSDDLGEENQLSSYVFTADDANLTLAGLGRNLTDGDVALAMTYVGAISDENNQVVSGAPTKSCVLFAFSALGGPNQSPSFLGPCDDLIVGRSPPPATETQTHALLVNQAWGLSVNPTLDFPASSDHQLTHFVRATTGWWVAGLTTDGASLPSTPTECAGTQTRLLAGDDQRSVFFRCLMTPN